jgi:crotonobetainyl-CoA:carnitine CoA-transferase CaiB-like acyl-CoA transferase
MVDTSLFEAGIALTYWQSAICLATGQSPGPMGSAHPLNAPYRAFRTADSWITIGACNQKNWLRLLAALETPQLGDDPRFASNAQRMRNLPALESVLIPLFKRRKSADWLDRLEAEGVPSGPVLDVGQMLVHPQTLAREMIVETSHPVAGTVKAIGMPVKFSASPGGVRCPAPLFGQYTREVLREHGFSQAEVDDLVEQGVVQMPESTKAVTP